MRPELRNQAYFPFELTVSHSRVRILRNASVTHNCPQTDASNFNIPIWDFCESRAGCSHSRRLVCGEVGLASKNQTL